MLTNNSILKNLKNPLPQAVKVLEGLAKFNIKVIAAKKQTENIDCILIGVDNALSGGRADYSASRVKSLIEKAMKVPAFPKSIKYKKTTKGHQLIIESDKSETDGNNN